MRSPRHPAADRWGLSQTHSHLRAFPAEMGLTSPPPGTGGAEEEVSSVPVSSGEQATLGVWETWGGPALPGIEVLECETWTCHLMSLVAWRGLPPQDRTMLYVSSITPGPSQN